MPTRPSLSPNVTRPRLISYKAYSAPLAALIALALLLAPTTPARAGHYSDPAYTGGDISWSDEDGTAHHTGLSQDEWGNYQGQAQGAPAAVSGTLTATFTWQPDPGQTLLTDPPPQQVLVTRRCAADWYDGGAPAAAALATCDDGFGDPAAVYGPDYYVEDYYGDGNSETFYDAWGISGLAAGGAGLIPHYSVQAGGPTVAVDCTPSVRNAGGGPPELESCMMVDICYIASISDWGGLNGLYLNQDSPGTSGWSPLPSPLVLYGGSEPSTSDALWLQAGDNPLVPGTTYTWYGPGGGSGNYTPPAASTNPNWVVGPLSGVPGILNFQCLLTYPNGTLALKQLNVEVGVRTDNVALVGWIDKLGVPGGATGLSTAGVSPQVVSDLPPTPPFNLRSSYRVGQLSFNNDHTDYDESNPATIMSAADRDYCLDWMFIYAANPDPAQVCTTLDPTPDYSLGWNAYSDFRDPGNFMNYPKFYSYVSNGQNYKLVNHFQVKYRVNPATGQFNGTPTVLHQDALVGTTINPTPFPPASLIPAQQGPMNGAVLLDPTNTYISLVDDGSPDVQGIRAFNTLEGLDVATPMFWENIGSEIEFMSPGWGNAGGWAWHRLPHQPYPTYNLYLNGGFTQKFPEWFTPKGNFQLAPYPFGTVPSTWFGAPTVPGGRNGDAASPPDPTVVGPSSGYTHLIIP